jgi:hypothetical protein
MKIYTLTGSVIGLVGLALGVPSVAQSAPKADKPPIVHIISGLDAGTKDVATILGPMPFETTMEISTITTGNLSQTPVVVQYRFVQPDQDGENPVNCTGPGVVFDELMRVVVPAFDTVHLIFPDSLDIPGQYCNLCGAVVEPLPPGAPDPENEELVTAGPWCLVAFYASYGDLGSAAEGHKVDVRVSGRIKFPEE